jgi:hypothetical protein
MLDKEKLTVEEKILIADEDSGKMIVPDKVEDGFIDTSTMDTASSHLLCTCGVGDTNFGHAIDCPLATMGSHQPSDTIIANHEEMQKALQQEALRLAHEGAQAVNPFEDAIQASKDANAQPATIEVCGPFNTGTAKLMQEPRPDIDKTCVAIHLRDDTTDAVVGAAVISSKEDGVFARIYLKKEHSIEGTDFRINHLLPVKIVHPPESRITIQKLKTQNARKMLVAAWNKKQQKIKTIRNKKN